MRTPRSAAIALALALGLTACGEQDDSDGDLQARVEALEEERDRAQQDAEELERENERLEAEIAALHEDEEPDEPEEPDERPQPAEQRTAEGLIDQLRLHLDPGPIPDEHEPGTTGWDAFEVPEEAQGVHPTTGHAATAILEALEAEALAMDTWEATVRTLPDEDDPDLAYAAVLSWGWADDAVAGRDVRVTMTRTDDGWQTGGAEVRHHCRRGVTDDDLCL